MTLFDFARSIRFRFLKTGRFLPERFTRFLVWHPRLYTFLERMNTVLPSLPSARSKALLRLGSMPRLSTLSVGAVVNEAVATMPKDACYVNVGLWHGFTFFAGMAGNPERACIGIDDFSQFGGPREACRSRFEKLRSPKHTLIEEDYRTYFLRHTAPIGVYYYDGEHSYDQQLSGLQIAEPFFIDGTIVIVDDTNWPEPRKATEGFLRTSRFQYDVLDLPTACDRHPTFWNGLMILRKRV